MLSRLSAAFAIFCSYIRLSATRSASEAVVASRGMNATPNEQPIENASPCSLSVSAARLASAMPRLSSVLAKTQNSSPPIR